MELFVRAAPAIFFWVGVGWYCTERKTVESTGSPGECRVRPVKASSGFQRGFQCVDGCECEQEQIDSEATAPKTAH